MDTKKFILPVAVVVIIGGFVLYKAFSGSPATQAPVDNGQTSVPSETINPNANPSGSTTPPPTTPPPTTQSGYKDGQYTGAVANTVYGDIQVKITVVGGKITDVKMLKTPTAGGHTAELVASSFPVLKSEAIAAQSAQVDVVSGATQNSEGFSQSLASALSQAA